MQSKENNKQEHEETQGEEQVTISPVGYSQIKKRLHELGCMGPSMQSQKGEEIPGVVQEKPQKVNPKFQFDFLFLPSIAMC